MGINIPLYFPYMVFVYVLCHETNNNQKDGTKYIILITIIRTCITCYIQCKIHVTLSIKLTKSNEQKTRNKAEIEIYTEKLFENFLPCTGQIKQKRTTLALKNTLVTHYCALHMSLLL